MNKQTKLNKSQILGLAIVGLSLFTYLGGPALVGGLFDLSFVGMRLKITVKDSETNQPIQGAVVTITGLDWQDTGAHAPLNVKLSPTGSDGKASSSINTWGTAYLSISADGYETQTGTMTAGMAETASKTFKLTPKTIEDPVEENPVEESPEDPVEDPENDPVEDPVEDDPVDEPLNPDDPEDDLVDVSEPVADSLRKYSMFTGALGAGVYLLGTIRREEQ